MYKLISVDLHAEFGLLKKPDSNEGIYFTYNCLHKPALLGILGAIGGLGGYYQSYRKKTKFPEYYIKLKHLKVGFQPLNCSNGNFQKTVITYNNSVGYANKDGNLIVKEQTLIKPNYRVYILFNIENKIEKDILQKLKKFESEYIPYLGKNDFQLWWDSYQEYDYIENYNPTNNYQIDNLFMKPFSRTAKENQIKPKIPLFPSSPQKFELFSYFEILPVEYDDLSGHYKLENFVFSNFNFSQEFIPNDLYLLKSCNKIIQLH